MIMPDKEDVGLLLKTNNIGNNFGCTNAKCPLDHLFSQEIVFRSIVLLSVESKSVCIMFTDHLPATLFTTLPCKHNCTLDIVKYIISI